LDKFVCVSRSNGEQSGHFFLDRTGLVLISKRKAKFMEKVENMFFRKDCLPSEALDSSWILGQPLDRSWALG